MIIQGVPQVATNGIEIVNGAKIVVPNLNQRAIVNGVQQSAYNGIEILNGVPKSAIASAFPGWTEVDPNGYISVDDVSLLAATWNVGDGVKLTIGANANYSAIYVDAGSLFWTGDYTINYRINVHNEIDSLIAINTGVQEQVSPSADWVGNLADVHYTSQYEVGGNNLSGSGGVLLNGASDGTTSIGEFDTKLDVPLFLCSTL